MGPSAHAWFQFTVDANGTRHIHASQEEHSRALVAQTVQQAGARLDIPAQRTVAGGFSHGGIMALSLLLTPPALLRAAMSCPSRLLPAALPHQAPHAALDGKTPLDRKGTRLNTSHLVI